MLVDVHSHLDHVAFRNDLDEVISRARSAGLSTIITNGINPATNRLTLKISEKYPDIVKAALGIYPIDALAEEIKAMECINGSFDPGWKVEPFDVDEEIKFIEEQAKEKKIIAIGEIGLDNHSVKGTLDNQIILFEKLLVLAKRTGLPVLVHSRKAEKEVIELLEKHEMKKVVLHCFTGKHSLAKKAMDLGYYFSIPSCVVRSSQFQELVKLLRTSCILTETDAPLLPIEKGKRSEPSDIAVSIKKLAELNGLDETEMKNIVFMNYKRVFR